MARSDLTRYAKDRPESATVDGFLARRILAGWSAEAVAVAGSVSIRTAHRWISEIVGVEDVVVGGYVATFATRRGKQPLRLGPWRRVR